VTVALALALALAADAEPKKNAALVAELADAEKSQAALDELVSRKEAAVGDLIGAAVEAKDLTTRGWAIVGLSRVGGKAAEKTVKKLTDDVKQPQLVRTWAAAAQIEMASDLETLVALAGLPQQFPAANRPYTMRITALAASAKKSVGAMILLASTNYSLQPQLAEAILAAGEDPLARAMLADGNPSVRQMAAAYLGTLAQKNGKAGNELVGGAVVRALAFKPDAASVPWKGGPLYLPNIGWDKTMGKQLAGQLIAWDVFVATRGDVPTHVQITNNLNSPPLAAAAGYSALGNYAQRSAKDWVKVWKQVAGADAARKILEAQKLDDDPVWKEALQ
jgi:hypothetical protein